MRRAHAQTDKVSFVGSVAPAICSAMDRADKPGVADSQPPALRRLESGDLAAIETHLLDLDLVSRNRRFHSGFSDAAVAAYVRRLDPSTDILFGAIEEDSGRIVGLAEARPAGRPRTVDVAASVLTPHRRRGLAHELVARTVAVAFGQGATAVELLFAPDDAAAAHIAAGLGASRAAPGRAVLLLAEPRL